MGDAHTVSIDAAIRGERQVHGNLPGVKERGDSLLAAGPGLEGSPLVRVGKGWRVQGVDHAPMVVGEGSREKNRGTQRYRALSLHIRPIFRLGATMLIAGQAANACPFLAIGGTAIEIPTFKWHPTGVFLGSPGSLFIGYPFAAKTMVSTLSNANTVWLLPLHIPVLAVAVPLDETTTVILIRPPLRSSLLAADQPHFHHCLMQFGFSHRQTVAFTYRLALALVSAAVLHWRFRLTQSLVLMGKGPGARRGHRTVGAGGGKSDEKGPGIKHSATQGQQAAKYRSNLVKPSELSRTRRRHSPSTASTFSHTRHSGTGAGTTERITL